MQVQGKRGRAADKHNSKDGQELWTSTTVVVMPRCTLINVYRLQVNEKQEDLSEEEEAARKALCLRIKVTAQRRTTQHRTVT